MAVQVKKRNYPHNFILIGRVGEHETIRILNQGRRIKNIQKYYSMIKDKLTEHKLFVLDGKTGLFKEIEKTLAEKILLNAVKVEDVL